MSESMETAQKADLLTAPEVHFTSPKIKHFEDMLLRAVAEGNNGLIMPARPYPTAEFLRYLVEYKQCLLHGSNNPGIIEFKPRRQTDYEGRMITAVFAAADGIAPIFYAILDRTNYKGGMRNMFKRISSATGESKTHYRFSIDADSLAHDPWIEGVVYVFSRDSFVQVADEEGQLLLEWTCPHPVRPIARIRVTPDDFPFLNDVQGHDERLQILITRFLTSYEEVRELNDGYAFSYKWTGSWGTDAITLIELFRADMPSMRIDLKCEPDGGPVWLHLRGTAEIKGFLQFALEQLRS